MMDPNLNKSKRYQQISIIAFFFLCIYFLFKQNINAPNTMTTKETILQDNINETKNQGNLQQQRKVDLVIRTYSGALAMLFSLIRSIHIFFPPDLLGDVCIILDEESTADHEMGNIIFILVFLSIQKKLI